MLRALTLPGRRVRDAAAVSALRARRAGEKVVRFFHDRGVRAPHIAEMWSAYASLTETPNRHAFIRTMRAVIDPGRPDRQREGPPLPRRRRADADRVGRPRRHHPGRSTPTPRTRCCRRAGSRSSKGPGHFLHVEHPPRFAEVLRDFIERTQPAQRNVGTYREMLRAGAA